MSNTDLRVICLGNPLHGNDGIGNAMFTLLSETALPANVELIDGGIGGMTLLPFFRDCATVLIIDLVNTQDEPGKVTLIEDLARQLDGAQVNKGEHGGDLTTLVKMLPVYLPQVPKVDLLAISASETQFFQRELDGVLHSAMPKVVTFVKEYVDAMQTDSLDGKQNNQRRSV